MELDIEKILMEKISECPDEEFESYSLLQEALDEVRCFALTLTKKQRVRFFMIVDKFNNYQAEKECEVIKLTLQAYKNLFK